MNYRHLFHAGNFADVVKHTLLVGLVRALQRKDKGFLFLDTHAGRGWYDLAVAAAGDSLARRPEWPEGIGRLWAGGTPVAPVADYLELVRGFDRRRGNLSSEPRFYPGSPWLVRLLARPVERLVFCEMQPEEGRLLRAEFAGATSIEVRAGDGYAAGRALLPPRERRALVLLDPPYEAPDEVSRLLEAIAEILRRLPSAVIAVWYPLTVRARADEFQAALRTLDLPTALAAELAVAGEDSGLKMRGCGLLVINPPWQFDHTAREALAYLATLLAQAPHGGCHLEWVVPAR